MPFNKCVENLCDQNEKYNVLGAGAWVMLEASLSQLCSGRSWRDGVSWDLLPLSCLAKNISYYRHTAYYWPDNIFNGSIARSHGRWRGFENIFWLAHFPGFWTYLESGEGMWMGRPRPYWETLHEWRHTSGVMGHPEMTTSGTQLQRHMTLQQANNKGSQRNLKKPALATATKKETKIRQKSS